MPFSLPLATRRALAAMATVLASAGGAFAQATPSSPPTSTSTSTSASTPAAEATPEPPRRKRRPWVIFDPTQSRYGIDISGGPVWWRPARDHDSGEELGMHFGIGGSQETQKKWAFVGARAEFLFYALDSKSFAITLPRYQYIAGLRLGPIEPEVGAGFSLVTADVFHADFSAGLFSPNAHAGLAVVAGPVRIAATAFSEYRWRWFGDANYFFRGFALTVDFGRSAQ
jgi:hypothetical protein